MPLHNLHSWNAIIVDYARSYRGLEALQLFQLMHRSGVGVNEISLSGGFSACAVIQGCLEGLQIHGLTNKSSFETNICAANVRLDMYGKCGALVEGHNVFDGMDRRDVVSWNAIIAAYEQNGYEEETLCFFSWMLRSGMEPDEFTYGSDLKACAGWQALNCGMEIHNRVIKSGLGLDFFVGSAVVDMYCKCGMMEEAWKLHDRVEKQTM
ncbi:Pentatricopeptide repeat, partial [Thalictrum thalictroides]